jgi:hypothetical protein
MRKFTLCVGAVVLCALTSPVLAAPFVNGVVLTGEYSVSLVDALGEVGLDNPGLDIRTLEFDRDASWYYMGLTVNTPPLDTDGGSTSRWHKTILNTILYADATGTMGMEAYYLDIVMDVGGVVSVSLYDGSSTPIPLAPADYQVSVGVFPYQALEVAISTAKMSLISTPYVFAQLDDTGYAKDDQIEGVVPEPATLCLLGIGAATVLVSRRKK